MAQLLGLSAEQVDGIRPLFPKERGVKRVEDRKVLRKPWKTSQCLAEEVRMVRN